ncbi:MAG: LysE family translocator [Rhodobacterales bacterium]|nr:LysE family translocator [Rhodobacterales bacterium]NCT12391.1 LysE family translocator [Rhodobacterales bacterium]
MTITFAALGLYALGIFLLFLTPGPVWVALTARALVGGFRAAWPLAIGVALGDLLWPLLAILGMGWVLSVFSGFLDLMRWVACATFILMGVLIIRHAGRPINPDSRLTRPGMWAGFMAGVAVILANPKAILFYSGMLPGFFDVTALSWPDIAAILAVSAAIPMAGNLTLALFIGRVRGLLTSPDALRRVNLTAGVLLIGVGLVIPLI